jgi:hypothetical protein
VARHLVLQQRHERQVLVVLGGRGLVAPDVEILRCRWASL